MTVATYRLKLARTNALKLKVSTRIPAQFEGGTGIDITRANGVYTVSLGFVLTGTANEITVINGSGAGGDPTFSLSDTLVLSGKTMTGGEYISSTISGADIVGGTASDLALTGEPTAPTASPGDNSTKIATTEYVDDAVSGIVSGVSSIAGNTGAFTLGEGLTNSTNVIHVADAGIEMDHLGATILDGTASKIALGDNIQPDPLLDSDATLTGKSNIFIGKDIATETDDRTTVSVGIGYGVLENAVDTYGATMIGFRNGSALVDTGYVTGLGIDCFTYTTTANNSTAVGAHCATFKGSVSASFIGGAFSAFSEGTISNSVVIGYDAGSGDLVTPTTDYNYSNCILIGRQAGKLNKANNNTLVGDSIGSASDITGADNTAMGSSAMPSLGAGTQNTAIGRSAGSGVTGGSHNTFVGYNTGTLVTSGDDNTAIGNGAGPAGNTLNTTCLGNGAVATGSNQVVLGDASVGAIRAQVTTITALSDRRDKTNIRDLDLGLDFINSLCIRRFDWNTRDGAKVDVPEAGIIAQELDGAAKAFDAEWMGLVSHINPDRLEATPGKLLFPLIKATQELWAMVKAQGEEIAALKAR